MGLSVYCQKKRARDNYQRIESLKSKLIDLEKSLIALGSESDYQGTLAFFDRVLTKLKKEIKAMPSGYRYTGVFYIRKPYLMPPVYERHDGSIFQKEDLVSWQIENDGYPEGSYYRSIYKDSEAKEMIEISDAEPIYQYPSKFEISELAWKVYTKKKFKDLSCIFQLALAILKN